jgi:DNA-binding Xre family transcriptional regulator
MFTVKFRLDEILKLRNMKARSFCLQNNLNYITVLRICHNQNTGITLEMIARICSALNIQPGELFSVEEIEK